ncbi:hypothetical protein FRC02_009266 [Tulasnella sp. 418]|nr:hypothetical protein FRC02_009266 [Tulasnella sp. 418]
MVPGENGSHLRIFCMDYQEEAGALGDAIWTPLLRIHGSNLLSLRVSRDCAYLKNMDAILSDLCPNLRELALPFVNLPSQIRKGIPTSNLEHLVLRAEAECESPYSSEDEDQSNGKAKPSVEDARKELDKLVDWILELPKIRHVTVCFVQSLTPRFPDIWYRCTLRGIGLQFVEQDDYFNHINEFPAARLPHYYCRVHDS